MGSSPDEQPSGFRPHPVAAASKQELSPADSLSASHSATGELPGLRAMLERFMAQEPQENIQPILAFIQQSSEAPDEEKQDACLRFASLWLELATKRSFTQEWSGCEFHQRRLVFLRHLRTASILEAGRFQRSLLQRAITKRDMQLVHVWLDKLGEDFNALRGDSCMQEIAWQLVDIRREWGGANPAVLDRCSEVIRKFYARPGQAMPFWLRWHFPLESAECNSEDSCGYGGSGSGYVGGRVIEPRVALAKPSKHKLFTVMGGLIVMTGLGFGSYYLASRVNWAPLWQSLAAQAAHQGLSPEIVVGVGVGAVALLVVIGLSCWCCRSRSRTSLSLFRECGGAGGHREHVEFQQPVVALTADSVSPTRGGAPAACSPPVGHDSDDGQPEYVVGSSHGCNSLDKV